MNYYYQLSGTYHDGTTYTIPHVNRDNPTPDQMRDIADRLISRDSRIATMKLEQFNDSYQLLGTETIKGDQR